RRGYRLPTEAEWEYACRARSTSKYCFGDDEKKLLDYAYYEKNSEYRTHPVAKKLPNAWGLYDMHGSVWEWGGDWYDKAYSKQMLNINATGPREGPDRVLRGGSFSGSPADLRSANRFSNQPADRYGSSGFRLARTYH